MISFLIMADPIYSHPGSNISADATTAAQTRFPAKPLGATEYSSLLIRGYFRWDCGFIDGFIRLWCTKRF